MAESVGTADARSSNDADMRQVLAALRRRARLVLVCVLLGAATTLTFSLLQTKEYTAEATLLFRDPGFDQQLFGTTSVPISNADREAATNNELVSLDVVADLTAKSLGDDIDGDNVADAVATDTTGESDLVSIEATDPDAEFSARMANAFAENYIDFRREADRRQVQDAIDLIAADYERLKPEERRGEGASLEQQMSRLATLLALQSGNAELVQRADVPSSPSSPKPLRNTILGGFIGLLIGLGLTVVFERTDRRLREPRELEEALGIPLLTTTPEDKSLARSEQAVKAFSLSAADSFHMLRARLRYFNVDREIRSIVITSAGPGEGKSTTAWSLASNAATAGERAVLVEADLHRPSIARRIGLAAVPGLSEHLSGQSNLESVIQSVPIDSDSDESAVVDVVVAGTTPPNPLGLLESDGMKALIDELLSKYDLVVVDSTPLAVLPDAIPLLKLVDGVIVVGRLNQITHDEAIELAVQLSNVGAPVLGVVANGARRSSGYYRYGYGAERSTD